MVPQSTLNLEDIARLAGVSRSTVSRVINDSPNVSAITRQRVLGVIAETNYIPNAAARTLVTQRTHILGVYIPYLVSSIFADPYFAVLLQAISTRASERDYEVMLWLQSCALDQEARFRRVRDNRTTDGLIVASAGRDDPLLKNLDQQAKPTVLNGRPWEVSETVNYVDSANVQGARHAVEHLYRLGRRRIATITGRLDLGAGFDRLLGYRQALERLGLPFEAALVAEGDFLEPAGYAGMQHLLDQRPDAVFCASDLSAMGALRALHEAGMRVPDDVALVGFDDMPFAQFADPQLTTVRQSVDRLGVLAVDGLIGLIDGTVTPPYQVTVPTQLVIRDSSGKETR